MNTRLWRMVRIMVTMLSLTMLVGLAGPASAQEEDPKDDCKQGGWETLTTADGEAFDNQGNCVSYVAADDGVPVAPDAETGPTITIDVGEPFAEGAGCYVTIKFRGFEPNATYTGAIYENGVETTSGDVPVDDNGSLDLGGIATNGNTYEVTVADPPVSSGAITVNC